jgi:hypothetical protein
VLEVTSGELFRVSNVYNRQEHMAVLQEMEGAANNDKFRKKTIRPFQQNTGMVLMF